MLKINITFSSKRIFPAVNGIDRSDRTEPCLPNFSLHSRGSSCLNDWLEFQDIAAAMSKDSRDKVIAARALAGIGECRFKKRELDQAQEYFKRSLDMYPEDEVVAYNLAAILFSVRKTVEAIRFFTMATQISPYWSDPYYKMGNAFIQIADYEKAKDAFKQFLKIESNSPRAAGVKKILDDLDKIKK